MARIGNQVFDQKFFNNYIINIFGEAFSHSSLSTEKLFEECNKYALQLKAFTSDANREYYDLLLNSEKEEDQILLNQRIQEIKDYLKAMKKISEVRFYDEDNEPLPCLSDFEKYFPYLVRPYRNTKEYEKALADGLTKGNSYEKESLVTKIETLYAIITKKLIADKRALNCKKDNLSALIYAYRVKDIGVQEIIRINALVNHSEQLHVGFKSTNNDIMGENELPFDTCPKELVSLRIQELLYKYNNEWKDEIPEFDYKMTLDNFYKDISSNKYDEREVDAIYKEIEQKRAEYNYAICLREARFHIEFERIHPFEDGNGRTGRIILNKHLIDNDFAPIIIASEIRDDYIKCINNKCRTEGAKQLAQIIQTLSSAQKSEMVSLYRNYMGMKPNELSNSERGEKNTENISDDTAKIIEGDTKIYTIKKSN